MRIYEQRENENAGGKFSDGDVDATGITILPIDWWGIDRRWCDASGIKAELLFPQTLILKQSGGLGNDGFKFFARKT